MRANKKASAIETNMREANVRVEEVEAFSDRRVK